MATNKWTIKEMKKIVKAYDKIAEIMEETYQSRCALGRHIGQQKRQMNK